MTTVNRIIIFDTTLRDGEQSPGASLNPEQKLEIALQLAKLGVDIIEAGFPVSSPGDFTAVKIIAKELKKGPVIAALSRAIKKDIDIAAEALKTATNKRIHTFIATSDIHLKYKLKKSRTEVLEIAKQAVKYAKKFTDDIEFSAEDAIRSDFEYLCRVIEEVIKAGATTVNIPDTVGYALPDEFGKLIKDLIEKVPNIHKAIVSVHCHNDLGLAVSNSISAIINGARQVECTINGIGERAGNASLEEISMILNTRKKLLSQYKIEPPRIDTTQIYKTSRLVSSLTGIAVQPNKAIVGSNAFAHEAGIHQDGVLKKRLTYEIITPQSVGIPKSVLVLGKHSGKHAFIKRLEELGFANLRQAEIEEIFNKFKILADKKKYVFTEDIISLSEEKLLTKKEIFTLEYFHILSGTNLLPTATIKVRIADKKVGYCQEAAFGDGPIDAAYKAIDKIVTKKLKWKMPPKLVDYSLRSVSSGKNAQGEVIVKLDYKGKIIHGRGISTDIIEASIKSYLNAINRIVLKS